MSISKLTDNVIKNIKKDSKRAESIQVLKDEDVSNVVLEARDRDFWVCVY